MPRKPGLNTIKEETIENLNNSVGSSQKPTLKRNQGYITPVQAKKIYDTYHGMTPAQVEAQKKLERGESGGRRTRRNRRTRRTRRQ